MWTRRTAKLSRVIERIRRLADETLEDDFTIDDPNAYAQTWAAKQVHQLKAGWEIREYVREENNKYTYQQAK